MSSKMRVRVTNTEIYAWMIELQLPIPDSEVVWAMHEIGIREAIPYCTLSKVFDSDSALKYMEGKVVIVDELNFFAKRMENLTPYEQRKVAACCAARQVDNLKDMINLTYSLDGISVINDFTDLSVVGKTIYLDVNGAITETEEASIDFVQYTRDYMNRVQAAITIHGVLHPADFSIKQVYNGQVFPEYFYDSNIVMSVAVKNRQGMEDYLYLPTDIHSVDKLKGRLGVNQFSECTIGGIQNRKLPDEIFQTVKGVKDIEELTLLNELCQAVRKFDGAQMKQLQMAAEYTGATDAAAFTGLAKHLRTFEFIPDVQNNAEYGKFIITESGLFNVDEVILPFIDYEGFAESKREATLVESGFVAGGFVGASRSISELIDYAGEFSQSLEEVEDNLLSFRLFSPLEAILHDEDAEYDYGEEHLDGNELSDFENEILEAIEVQISPSEIPRGLMAYFDESREVARKVYSAFPTVEIYEGSLYGVLECRLKEPLNEAELKILKDAWEGQMSDGWGEGFEQREIRTNKGNLYVSFWRTGPGYCIQTEEELKGLEEIQVEDRGMHMQ